MPGFIGTFPGLLKMRFEKLLRYIHKNHCTIARPDDATDDVAGVGPTRSLATPLQPTQTIQVINHSE